MRKAFWIIIILVILPVASNAQHVIDKSGESVSIQLLKSAIVALSNQVKDPLSIQIRHLKMGRGAGTPTLCGEFNAKNSFGGYFGFSPFFYRQGAEAAGILNPEIISDDYGITLDNVMKVESQAIIARNLESFGCIPTGLSQSLNKRIDQALGK